MLFRSFEMKTMQLLTEECGFKGLHLGGSRKPDGVVYTEDAEEDYGIIIDTKAYSGGYSLPISQADEMERYVRENQERRTDLNPNRWWKTFGENVSSYHFLFISGHFKGKYRDQLERIERSTGVRGAALNVRDLLLLAEELKAERLSFAAFRRRLFCAQEEQLTLRGC